VSDIERDNYVFPGKRLERGGLVIGQGQGISLRDAAALAALPAVISVCASDTPREIGKETHEQMFARKAWAVADAFIAARETGEKWHGHD
jgi:hypothetical protein